ncbi:MAG: hypothetical protein JNG90_10465 [Planctomycetaceae bacterium]|nr:hypothetical protein [Planctomycetaceae bacterium]
MGGSLLESPDWQQNFLRWLHQNKAGQTVLVVGGGAEVEQLRAEQSQRGLTDEAAHWVAIGCMRRNARRVAEALFGDAGPGLVRGRLEEIHFALRSLPLVVVDPLKLLRHDERLCEGTRLPQSWDVTSDSIAARIAQLIGCETLVLLKSQLPPIDSDYATAAAAGYVDRFFPQAAAHLMSVTCVNLRTAALESAVLAADAKKHAHGERGHGTREG